MKSIDGYGCWCHFDANIKNARGKAMNTMDETCKSLLKGYYCIMKDAGDEGESCDPVTVSFSPAVDDAFDLIDGGMEAEAAFVQSCNNLNSGSNCAARACMVEALGLEKKEFLRTK